METAVAAGNGGRGKDAECNQINFPGGSLGYECRTGPQAGGDSGRPGLGGKGGDGARGGNGADLRLFGPSAAAKLLGFITLSNLGGEPGVGAPGGYCGAQGQEGGGGSRRCCPGDRGSGRRLSCPGAAQGSQGANASQKGANGQFSITVRNLADLFVD